MTYFITVSVTWLQWVLIFGDAPCGQRSTDKKRGTRDCIDMQTFACADFWFYNKLSSVFVSVFSKEATFLYLPSCDVI
jgi:hypothetical protein